MNEIFLALLAFVLPVGFHLGVVLYDPYARIPAAFLCEPRIDCQHDQERRDD